MKFVSEIRPYMGGNQLLGRRFGDFIRGESYRSLHQYYFDGYPLLENRVSFLFRNKMLINTIKYDRKVLSYIYDLELKDLLDQMLDSWDTNEILSVPSILFNEELKFALQNWAWLQHYDLSEKRSIIKDQVTQKDRVGLFTYNVPYFVSDSTVIDSSLWDKFSDSPNSFLNDLESNDWKRVYDPNTVQLPQSVLDNSEEGMKFIANRIESTSRRVWIDAQNRILYVALGHLYDVPWRRIVEAAIKSTPFSLGALHIKLRSRIKDLILCGPKIGFSLSEEKDVGKIIARLDEELEKHRKRRLAVNS